MRINLDETPGDQKTGTDLDEEDAPRLHLDDEDDAPRLNLDDDAVGLDPDAPDGFVIRRDPLEVRRRRRAPKPLSPFQQRLIAVGLVVVIAAAGISLATYWINVRGHAERIPPTALSSPIGQGAPRPGSGAAVPGREIRALAPGLDQSEPEDSSADRDTPTEGIH